jgi:hypothetical protein
LEQDGRSRRHAAPVPEQQPGGGIGDSESILKRSASIRSDGRACKVRWMRRFALASQSATWMLKSAGVVNTRPSGRRWRERPSPRIPAEASASAEKLGRAATPDGAALSFVLVRSRLAARIVNHRVANWTLENASWTPAKVARYVTGKLGEWGYRLTEERAGSITAVTELLARAALTDGGRRINVHLADQDHPCGMSRGPLLPMSMVGRCV